MAGQIKVGDIVYVRATGMLVVVTAVDGVRVSFDQKPFFAKLDEVTLVFLKEDVDFDFFAHDKLVRLVEAFLSLLADINKSRQRIEDLIAKIKQATDAKNHAELPALFAQLDALKAHFIKLVKSSDAAFKALSQTFDNMTSNLPSNADSLTAMFERVQGLYDAEDTSTPESPINVLDDVTTVTRPRKNGI